MTDSGGQLCRLCLSSKGVILPIFDGVIADKFSVSIPVKIMSCLSIEISSDDVLPTLICYRCLYEIDRFHEFKAACGKVDALLQECVASDSNLIVTESDDKGEIFNAIQYCNATDDAPVHTSSASNSPRDVEEIPEVDDHSSAEGLEALAFKCEESVDPCGIRNASDTSSPKSAILAFVTATNTNANPSHLEDEELPIAIVNDGGISSPSNGLISSVVGNEGTASSPSKEVVSLTQVTEGTSSPQSNKKTNEIENETTNTSRNDTVSCDVNEKDQVCFKPFERDTLKKHEKINGNKSKSMKVKVGKPFSCKNCPGSYKTKRNLRIHEKFHCKSLTKETKEKLKAEELMRKAARKAMPKTVVQLPVCCRFCSTSFTVKRRWIHHEKYSCTFNPNKQRMKRTWPCKICNESFEYRRALKHHNQLNISTHGLQCRFCPKIHFSKYNLEKHESIHLGSKPYNCKVCDKAFNDQSNCTNHEKIHKNEKPFLCSTCGKAFMFKKDLRNHEFLHTGIRDVMCEICSKSFADKGNLRSHQKHVHSTLRKYRCPHCASSFIQPSKLQKHIRIHFSEKPYNLPKGKRKRTKNVKESDSSTTKD